MITTNEAHQIVMNQTLSLKVVNTPLTEAQGKVLQETLLADRDFPPFDRVAMDGIAYNIHHVTDQGTLIVEGMQLAGSPQQKLQQAGHCMEVMTGAILPQNTNTVTRYEDVEVYEEHGHQVAKLLVKPSAEGQNVHKQGTDQQAGNILLEPGVQLGPAEIAVAASIGKTNLKVSALPSFGIISTGDELVDVQENPQPYQIRKSNVYALQAALTEMNVPGSLYHFEDTREAIQEGLTHALAQHDVLILSGGVSKGKRDYVPEVLEELGVEKLFHKVKQRPGKPFWFGKNKDGKVVFALPGNPVSTFMCFHRYVKPWLYASLGKETKTSIRAVLSEKVNFEPEITYFLQVQVQTNKDGILTAHPFHGHGSGDFANLLHCHGFLELPAERSTFRTGEDFPLILFRNL